MLERTGIDGRVDPAVVERAARTTRFGTVEVRICDAQTRGEESFALAGLIAACIAQTALDYDEHGYDGAGRAACRPRDRGEPLAGDPPRDERQADRLPRAGPRSRRGRRSSGCSPGPSRRAPSSASRSTCRSATAPSAPARRSTPGVSIEDIYRDAVAETRRTYTGAAEAPSTPRAARERVRRSRL